MSQNNQIVSFDINMQRSIFFDSFFYDGCYYILTKAQFIRYSYDSTLLSLTKI